MAFNPILRTRIVHTSSGAMQVVMKGKGGIQWLFSSSVSEYMERDINISMSPGSILARWAIIAPDNGALFFIWTIHHALYDGWTFPMIANQFHQAYYNNPIQPQLGYNVFIKYLSMQDHDEGRAYWQTQLTGARNSTVFPIPPIRFHEPLPRASAECQIEIPSKNPSGITLSCVIRAAWSILVARLTNADDIVFGATLIGRNAPILGVERLTGPTITTVPVRVKIDAEQNLIEFLADMQKQATDMITYEHFGLQNISRLGEDSKAACDIQTLLVIQPRDEVVAEVDTGKIEAMGRLFHSLDALDMGGKLDSFNSYTLMLVFNQNKDGVSLQASFDETLIPSISVRRVLGQMQRIMQQLYVAAEDLPQRIGDIDCMSERDLQDLWDWNATVPISIKRCIHDRISERVLQQPSSPAICAHDGDVTFQGLEDLSTKLSRHLFALGVGRQVLVPLCFEKSIWTTVAMLSVLKAGGGFIAMDMTQPEQRLRAIVLQAEAKVILTSAENLELSGKFGVPTMVVNAANITKLGEPGMSDEATATSAEIPRGSPWPADPSSTAFVVFTSGTTGIPKGIMISHKNFCSASENHATELGFHSESRVFDFASYSFDIAIDNALSSLITGGCLCVPHDKERKDGIEDAMERMKVNVVNLTPSVAKLFDPLALPSLKVLILAGEAADAEVAARWSSRVRLVNAYGPAECQICTIGTIISKPEDTASIGRGAGSVTWIVDPTNYSRLVPIGAVGELLIEGPVVSEGYLKNAERTEAAFVHDPKWPIQGFNRQLGRSGRLYKTGDLVRYGSDGTGTIEYLGRKDRQVKVRGQRVELGEIEHQVKSVLSQNVREIAAEVVELNGSQLLLGFVCLADQHELDGGVQACHETRDRRSPVSRLGLIVAGVEEKLSRVLPSYMIPTAFVLVEKIPITVTGKTDRKLLRERALSLRDQWISLRQSGFGEKRGPSTDMEFTLRGLWAQVLGVEAVSIGADEDFFRRGGDSITAMKLAAAARSLGLPLKVPDVFQTPYLSKMAATIESQKLALGATSEPEVIAPFSLLEASSDTSIIKEKAALLCGITDPALVEDAYPCTPMQEGLMASTIKCPSSYVNRSIIEVFPHTDIMRLRKAWEEVVGLHAILRTRIVQLDSIGSLQVVLKEDVAWAVSGSLSGYLAQDELEFMVPGSRLTRFAVISETGENTRLVWTIHHALYDAWTVSQIVSQVREIYRQSGVATKPIVGFNTFIKYISAQDPMDCHKYWQSLLCKAKGSSTYPPLPSGTYEPHARSMTSYQVAIPSRLIPSSRATMSSVIRGAWSILMANIIGSDDVVFGTTLVGRNAPVVGIEHVLGPTITTVPIRIRLDWSQNTTEFFDDIQDQAIRMMPFEHTGLPSISKFGADAKAAVNFQTLLVVQPPSNFTNDLDDDASAESLFQCFDLNGKLDDFNSYALMLVFSPEKESIMIQASFDQVVIPLKQVERLMRQLERVLCQLCSDPMPRAVKDIECITQEELQQIWAWNKSVPEPVEQRVHDLISLRANESPNATAICAWDGELSYRELDDLSSYIAQDMKPLQIGPLVPLCFEKSMWTSVAMLAVIKAGSAFVALDVSQPEARLKAIVEQNRAKVIICSVASHGIAVNLIDRALIIGGESVEKIQKDRFHFSRSHGVPNGSTLLDSRAICHENKLSNGYDTSSTDKSVETQTTSSLLYVVFTSGTTGKPKGVMITHTNLCSAAKYQSAALGFRSKSRVFDFSSYSFDACIFNFLHTMLAGGCLCVPSDIDRRENIAKAMNLMDVNLALLTPSVSRLLDPRSVPKLEVLLLGGEALASSDVATWMNVAQVMNVYGPAESTIVSTANRLIADPNHATTIGHGLGTVTWIVSENNTLAPIGSVGELFVEGPLVGAGYLGDPAKTAVAFVSDPSWLIQGDPITGLGRRGRLYKTGDLVRYSSEGLITYVGRKDSQLKLHGQRVELGELEHYLNKFTSQFLGTAAAVIAEVIEVNGSQKLIGIISRIQKKVASTKSKRENGAVMVKNDIEIGLSDLLLNLNDSLRVHLPEYMIPSGYVEIEHVPMLASGKIDRKSLKESISSLSNGQIIYADSEEASINNKEALTGPERKLRTLWARVLKVNDELIGRNDKFFKHGGDSIMAMRLIGLARNEGFSLTMAEILGKPRLRDMAAKENAEENLHVKTIAPFSLIGPVASDVKRSMIEEAAVRCSVDYACIEDIYPCSPLQEGLVALTAKQPGAYVSRTIVDLHKDVNIARFRKAWEKIVMLNPILRTRIVYMEQYGAVQVVLKDGIHWNSWTIISQNNDLEMPFGSPLSLWALSVGDQSRFAWIIHHALYDGWSMSAILNQVQQSYREIDVYQGVNFNAFIDHLRMQTSENARAYWQLSLSGFRGQSFPPLSSRSDQPMANNTINRKLAVRVDSQSVTTSTIIRAAWALLVAKITHTNDTVFGVTLTGRNALASTPGLEKAIGPTITTVPIRVQIDNKLRIPAFLDTIQRQTVEMIPFEYFGLQNIRRICLDSELACDFQTLLLIDPPTEDQSPELGSECIFPAVDLAGNVPDFSTYALMLVFSQESSQGESSLAIQASFDSKVLDRGTVERLLGQLERVLQQICASHSTQTLEDIDYVSEQDLRQIWQWNATMPETSECYVHDLISAQVAYEPDAHAICAWDGNLTYQQLDEASWQLARHFKDIGVTSGILVPIFFEKSKWISIAIMGIIKAEGAFVALDVGQPEERLRAIIQQTGSKLGVSSATQFNLASRLMPQVVKVGPLLRHKLGRNDQQKEENGYFSFARASPSALLYVVFTSGSTGTPKGVVITHSNFCSVVQHQAVEFGFKRTSRVYDFASYSFDVAINNMLMTFSTGGCLCVPHDVERINDLEGSIVRTRANLINVTSSVAKLIEPSATPGVETLLLEGNRSIWRL